jgi:hypothetical protein
MALFAIAGILVGALLGLRYRLIVLAPAICLACAIVVAESAIHGESAWWMAIAIVVVATALQLGFFGGFSLRLARHGAFATRSKIETP